jgi:hypothetical protein
MSNPSKYDHLAREMMLNLQAEAVVVLVVNGLLGTGCAGAETAVDPEFFLERRKLMAAVLRKLAHDMENVVTPPDQAEHRRGSA